MLGAAMTSHASGDAGSPRLRPKQEHHAIDRQAKLLADQCIIYQNPQVQRAIRAGLKFDVGNVRIGGLDADKFVGGLADRRQVASTHQARPRRQAADAIQSAGKKSRMNLLAASN